MDPYVVARDGSGTALSETQALELLRGANKIFDRLVEFEAQGKTERKQLKKCLADITSRADHNAKKLQRAQLKNRYLLKRLTDHNAKKFRKVILANRRLMKRLVDIEIKVGARGLKNDTRRLSIMTKAIQRALFLDPEKLSYPHRLTARRFSLFSQNEEDGITHAIFDKIGEDSHRFVEIGAGSNGGNSGFLARECGWNGMMLETDKALLAELQLRFEASGIACVGDWVTRENLNNLVRDNGCSGEIDLLSIDIDGNDYWIWEALTACSPRLVIIEYNSLFGPDRAVVVRYDPEFNRHQFVSGVDGRHIYYGASLQALNRLAEQKGYRLVATEPRGVNAFFLRNDVGPEIPACDPGSAYQMLMKYGSRGHDLFEYIREHELPLIDLDAD